MQLTQTPKHTVKKGVRGMKKKSIIMDIVFAVFYIVILLICYFNSFFEEKNTVSALMLYFIYTLCGLSSFILDCDFKNNTIRPTVRTIGLFVLGIIFLIFKNAE